MLADTSDIHDFSLAQHRHAADLSAVAADLAAARMPADAFGPVGGGFVTAFNAALTQQSQHVTHLAERLDVAGSTAREAANAYELAEEAAGQAISARGD
jgi:Excreted virulence factor EspC, type VII ESX diderm